MKTDPEDTPPTFIERLDLFLIGIWGALLSLPLIYLIPVASVGYRLEVQVPLPKTAEDWSNLRLGIVILAIGGCVLYSIFSEIVFLITGKKLSSFQSDEKKRLQVTAIILIIVYIVLTSLAIWLLNRKH
jgi:hypothetical protein